MTPVIDIKDLTKIFGDFTAVDRVTLEVKPGEVCGFLGPNGAGKSTLVKMLCGILAPSSGNGRVLGYDLLTESESIKKHIGYMSQKFSLYDDLTVSENLDFYSGLYGVPRTERSSRKDEMLELADLADRRRSLVSHLSVGWKQRLALGCALISRPAMVFLDEPTSGVSPTSRRSFFNIIQQLANRGTSVIVTTHFMDEAERCDRLAFISQGRLIAFDTPGSLRHDVIKGYMVELSIPGAVERIDEIESLAYVRECSLHGPVLHVLLNEPGDAQRLRRDAGAEPHPIEPGLEDVFIALSSRK